MSALARMLAMSQRRIHACPSLLGFSTLSRVGVSCRSVVVVAQPFSDVTWRVRSGQGCSGKTASVPPRVHDLHQHVTSGPRSMLKATVNVVASPELPCTCLFDAPPDLHWWEAAGGLVDVHDSMCADSVLIHQPARSGLWSSFTNLVGFL